MLITDVIPLGLTALIAAGLLLGLFQRDSLRADPQKAMRLFLGYFLGIWWALLAIAVLFKLRTFLLTEQGDPFANINLVPFTTIAPYLAQGDLIQLVGNIFILFPLPLFLYFNFPHMKNRTLLLSVLCVTVLIEPVQLLINIITNAPANVIDIDDFFLNATGCLLGLGLTLLLKHRVSKKCQKGTGQN
jgi:glycopeptide antibiotics resistance protein